MASDDEVEFARTDGTQMFVRASDLDRVLSLIERYVEEHGCDGMFQAVDDRIEGREERRSQRTFALAPPKDGWITIWEDGSSADRRLARYLSQELKTSVRWLMVSSSTGSWAFFAYDDGEQVDGGLDEESDPIGSALDFARRENLPHAVQFFSDPTLGSYLAGLKIPAIEDLGVDIAAAAEEAASKEPEPAGLVKRTVPCRSATA